MKGRHPCQFVCVYASVRVCVRGSAHARECLYDAFFHASHVWEYSLLPRDLQAKGRGPLALWRGVAARSRIRRWRCRRASMALEGRRCWHSKQSLVDTTGGVSLPPRVRHWGYYSEEAPSRGRCWRVERRREGDEGPRSSPAPRGSVKRSRLRCHFVRRASAPPRVQWRSLILLCQVTRGVLGQGACACVCACMCACARTCVYVYVSGASI